MLDKYKSQPLLSDTPQNNSEEETVLPSSTDLFYFYRQLLVRFAQLSTGKPFLDLSKMFGRGLRMYSDFLMSQLPKQVEFLLMSREEKKSLNEEEIKMTCYLINTSDYCSSTVSQVNNRNRLECSWRKSWHLKYSLNSLLKSIWVLREMNL